MGGALRGFLERVTVAVAATPFLSRMAGWLADRRLPRPLLRGLVHLWAQTFRADLGEAEVPLGGYPTFNAFFTRRLRPGTREVASGDGVIVCPCDGRVNTIGRVPEDLRLEQVKGRTYGLDALLASPTEAAAFSQGVQATLYLSPGMYHRVHAPTDGQIVGWRYVEGRSCPVNALGLRQVDGLFAVNERVIIQMATEAFGPMAVVMVGAANVCRITLAFTDLATHRGQPGGLRQPEAPIRVRRGEEIGVFNLGSTVVLLAGTSGLGTAGAEPGQALRMGQPLFVRRP
jgi:phosphatidylserine decarboxylase